MVSLQQESTVWVTRQRGGVALVQTEVTTEVNSPLSNCLFKACQHSTGTEKLYTFIRAQMR